MIDSLMKNYDLPTILKDQKFLGLRIAICAFTLAFVGFLSFVAGLITLGLLLFVTALVMFIIGFIIHLNRFFK